MIVETVQTVKLKIRQPAPAGSVIGALPLHEVERLRTEALEVAKMQAAASGAEVLEYTVHSVNIVDG